MARKNRKKVHLQARLAAEARAQARAQARREARIAKAKADATIRALLAGRPVVGRRQVVQEHPTIRQMRENMRFVGTSTHLQRRVIELARACQGSVPSLFTAYELPFLMLLADQTWARRPGSLRPLTGSRTRRERELVLHLLTHYPVPPFLLAGIDVPGSWIIRMPEEERWIVGLVAHLGQGLPARELPGSELLPAPLTRRMLKYFLASPARLSPIEALRAAQVRGFGGDPRWAAQLCRAGLDRLRGSDPQIGEPFWQRVIQWVVAEPLLTTSELRLLLRHIERQRHTDLAEGRHRDPWRRTVTAVLAEAEEEAARRWSRQQFTDPGFVNDLFGHGWSIAPLLTPRALYEEGKAMSHCVGMYKNLVRKGKVAIYSLRLGDTRVATIEVALGAQRITQVKSKANRAPPKAARLRVSRWARINRLRLP